jgi:putative addiction module component (TIGR02574 family)
MRDMTADEIIAAAMTLPPEARAQIAEELFDSLDPARKQVDAAWAEEIERRISDVEAGRADLVPHDQAMAEARRRLRTKRAG